MKTRVNCQFLRQDQACTGNNFRGPENLFGLDFFHIVIPCFCFSQIVGYVGEVLITVYVVTRDNEPHLHTATGPGSSKSSCKEIILEDGTPAVQMILKPVDENDEMIAV